MPRNAISNYVEDPLIRSMRVRAWFHAVSKASGLTSHELERVFSTGEGSPRSCIWNKYRRGEVVPRSAQNGDGSPKLVERVETRYPGSAMWVLSPLWRLADNHPMQMDEVRHIYAEMPSGIRSIFVLPEDKSTKIFWRRLTDPAHVCAVLIRFRDLDAMTALLAMVKEAEIIQDRKQYRLAANATLQVLRSGSLAGGTTVFAELEAYLHRRWNGYLN